MESSAQISILGIFHFITNHHFPTFFFVNRNRIESRLSSPRESWDFLWYWLRRELVWWDLLTWCSWPCGWFDQLISYRSQSRHVWSNRSSRQFLELQGRGLLLLQSIAMARMLVEPDTAGFRKSARSPWLVASECPLSLPWVSKVRCTLSWGCRRRSSSGSVQLSALSSLRIHLLVTSSHYQTSR